MFLGEIASLEAILRTQIVRVPKPIKVVELPAGNTVLVMDHLEMKSLNRHSVLLGTQLADLHLHNQQLREKMKKEGSTVKDKGKWNSCLWIGLVFLLLPAVVIFHRQRIQSQMDLIERNSADREARELWAQLQDLWGGNVAEDDSGPIIFDPASFYGHSEYDLAIAGMFGGFSNSFYYAYHSKIPRAEALSAVPLHEPLEPFWFRVERVFYKHCEKPCKVNFSLSAVWKTPDLLVQLKV